MNLTKLQQSGRILDRLLKEAERMGNTTMSVRIPELKLFQEVTTSLWQELNRSRNEARQLRSKVIRVTAALQSSIPDRDYQADLDSLGNEHKPTERQYVEALRTARYQWDIEHETLFDDDILANQKWVNNRALDLLKDQGLTPEFP